MPVGVVCSRRLMLRDWRRAIDEVERLAAAWGWSQSAVSVCADPFEEPTSVSWDGAWLGMTYYDDWDVRLSYLIFYGAEAGKVSEAFKTAEARLDTWSLDELLGEARGASDPDDLAEAVERAAYGAPLEFDERFYALIDDALRHNDARVREGGIWAVSMAQYPQFQPLIMTIAETDEEEMLREMAAVLVAGTDSDAD
ncbi:hypothetical protein [Amycolatopsis taiwanensis]|uniref:hypothetical protein n=1 Tax=Amycolatopsis taiwanensis TaxID=342230 RepID=UPI0012EB4383|nr:hypothetical protein [Amycolatopsis taiwanensis]